MVHFMKKLFVALLLFIFILHPRDSLSQSEELKEVLCRFKAAAAGGSEPRRKPEVLIVDGSVQPGYRSAGRSKVKLSHKLVRSCRNAAFLLFGVKNGSDLNLLCVSSSV